MRTEGLEGVERISAGETARELHCYVHFQTVMKMKSRECVSVGDLEFVKCATT